MARDDTIFVISPGYLEAVSSCLTKYKDFVIQGYDSSEKALLDLERTPSYSYLGFCYVNDKIEDEDFENLRLLVNKINIMYQDLVDPENDRSRAAFLFILSSKEGKTKGTSDYVRNCLRGLDLSNVLIMFYDFKIMTDTIIKTQMFGTILLRRREFEIVQKAKEISENRTDSMIIELPFGKKFIDLFSELTFIEVDSFLTEYVGVDSVLCDMRRFMYLKDLGLLERIKREVGDLPLASRVFYECCLRNLDLVKESL
jgi:hypothetical protein